MQYGLTMTGTVSALIHYLLVSEKFLTQGWFFRHQN